MLLKLTPSPSVHLSEMQHRLMGQPLIPTNPAYQQQLNMAMQQQQLRAQVNQLGGQLLLSPRLGTPVSQMSQMQSQLSQSHHQQAALMGMPPMVSSSDATSTANGAMLYNTSPASLQGFMNAGQPTTDLSPFGLVNQPGIFDYPGAVESAAGMSTNTLTFVKG